MLINESCQLQRIVGQTRGRMQPNSTMFNTSSFAYFFLSQGCGDRKEDAMEIQ